MSTKNGARLDAPPTETEETYKGKKYIELVLDSGEVVLVPTLSIYLRRAIDAKALEQHPPPDEKAYERPVDPEKAAIPGMVHLASENPDYQKAFAQALLDRLAWSLDYVIENLCIWPAGKDNLIAKYAAELEALTEVLDIEGGDWGATWKYLLISDKDRNNILQAVNDNLMLTEAEVREAMRIFRPILSGARSSDGD